MDLVPVVDIRDPGATSLGELDRACRDHGFFLLSGHEMDQVIADTFAAARQFFDAPNAVKDSVRRSAEIPLGYNERELTKRLKALSTMAEPIMLMFMGLIVGVIVSSLILPIFKLSRAVT